MMVNDGRCSNDPTDIAQGRGRIGAFEIGWSSRGLIRWHRQDHADRWRCLHFSTPI